MFCRVKMAISHQNGVIDSCDYEMLCFESIPLKMGKKCSNPDGGTLSPLYKQQLLHIRSTDHLVLHETYPLLVNRKTHVKKEEKIAM